VRKKSSGEGAGPERTRAGKVGWRFQPHCRITRPSSCSESIKQPPAAAGRRQIYDALICRNGKAHGSQSLPNFAAGRIVSLDFIETSRDDCESRVRIYENDTNLLYLHT